MSGIETIVPEMATPSATRDIGVDVVRGFIDAKVLDKAPFDIASRWQLRPDPHAACLSGSLMMAVPCDVSVMPRLAKNHTVTNWAFGSASYIVAVGKADGQVNAAQTEDTVKADVYLYRPGDVTKWDDFNIMSPEVKNDLLDGVRWVDTRGRFYKSPPSHLPVYVHPAEKGKTAIDVSSEMAAAMQEDEPEVIPHPEKDRDWKKQFEQAQISDTNKGKSSSPPTNYAP